MPVTVLKVLCLIPARGGSKGLPGKNLRDVAGISQVGRAARVARRFLSAAGVEGTVLVDTDSPEIAEEGVRWGAEVPFLRPPHLARDETPMIDAVLHALDRVELWRGDHDAVLLLQPTSPLRSVDDVLACFRAWGPGGPSVVAVTDPEHPAEQAVRLDERAVLAWAFPGAASDARRQDLPRGYRIAGSVYIAAPAWLRRHRAYLVPGLTRAVVVPRERAIDVDTAADLAFADALLRSVVPHPIAIGRREVGPGRPCYVIAEAGVNHDGDVDAAHRLVEAAADAGADAVKFQTFDPRRLVSRAARMAEYQVANTGRSETQLAMLERLALPRSAHAELRAHARERGVEFLSTPFDEASADFLAALGVPAIKVGSGEITNHPFLDHLSRLRLPILLSTGMADLVEVGGALDVVEGAGAGPVALLHCVSRYPAEPADANLSAMATLQAAFGRPAGWSDHTLGTDVSLASVAMGACVLEKHLTLDTTAAGPDHKASLDAPAFARMVRAVRAVEAARGDGVKRPRPDEVAIAAVARRSLHAARDLLAGQTLAAVDLVALRPGTGIAPSRLSGLVGRTLRGAVAEGDPLREEDLA